MIEAAGLGRRSVRGTLVDLFRDRAMLPIRSADGTVAGFIGRAAKAAGAGVPKYLNSPGTGLYDKSEVLFGLWEAREALAGGAQPVIVEGPLDAMAVSAAGGRRYAAVAPCGTALTARHVAALQDMAALETAGVLIQPLADLVIDAEVDKWRRWLRHAEGRINALRAAAPLVAAMPPEHVARQVARLAERLDLEYAIVTGAVTDALPQVIANAGGDRNLRGPAGRCSLSSSA